MTWVFYCRQFSRQNGSEVTNYYCKLLIRLVQLHTSANLCAWKIVESFIEANSSRTKITPKNYKETAIIESIKWGI